MERGPERRDVRSSWLRRLLRATVVGASEITLAVTLVAVLTGIFGLSLLVLFPEGSGLSDLYSKIVRGARDPQGRATTIAEPEREGPAAVLKQISRSVKDRPADSVAWQASRVGMQLDDRHAIQTLARSGAVVAIGERDEVRLRENSLVVFQYAEREAKAGRSRTSIVLLGGGVEGRLGAGGATALGIVAGGAETELRAIGRTPADFRVTANTDQSSTLTVLSGKAEVEVGGQSVKLAPDESVTVSGAHLVGEPVRIPDAPQLLEPADREVVYFSTAIPRVALTWAASPGAESYQLTVARDAAFGDLVFEQKLATTSFVHGNLTPGQYHWKVQAFAGHRESRTGNVRTLEIVRDADAPSLEVQIPESIDAEQLTVRGVTEPGAEVLVGQESVRTSPQGGFEVVIMLKRGVNLVVVEAIDGAGNSSYRSQYVEARF